MKNSARSGNQTQAKMRIELVLRFNLSLHETQHFTSISQIVFEAHSTLSTLGAVVLYSFTIVWSRTCIQYLMLRTVILNKNITTLDTKTEPTKVEVKCLAKSLNNPINLKRWTEQIPWNTKSPAYSQSWQICGMRVSLTQFCPGVLGCYFASRAVSVWSDWELCRKY